MAGHSCQEIEIEQLECEGDPLAHSDLLHKWAHQHIHRYRGDLVEHVSDITEDELTSAYFVVVLDERECDCLVDQRGEEVSLRCEMIQKTEHLSEGGVLQEAGLIATPSLEHGVDSIGDVLVLLYYLRERDP